MGKKVTKTDMSFMRIADVFPSDGHKQRPITRIGRVGHVHVEWIRLEPGDTQLAQAHTWPSYFTRVESLCCMVPRVRRRGRKAQWALTTKIVQVLDSTLGLSGLNSRTTQMEVKKKVVGVDHGELIERWLRKHRLSYTAATRHPLILSIRDGTVHLSAFKRWLGQDYVFVRAFVPFVASVLIKAWRESDDRIDVEVILSGMAALNDEIEWFKIEASKWDVQLNNIVTHKTTEKYCRFLESLMSPEVEYTVAITALWAIEAVYQESFAHCLEEGCNTPPELREACQRWGNEGFGQYCSTLRNIANRRLEKVAEDLLDEGYDKVLKKAEVLFLRVLEYEVDFWNMSLGDS